MRTGAFAVALLALLFAIFALWTTAAPEASGVVDATSQRCARHASSVTVTHRAGLVVTFGNRITRTFCIEFSEDTISGLQLLQRSGLPLVTSGSGGLGAAVCSIDGAGSSDPTNCFASCSSGRCAYWAYYRFVSGAWQFSQAGASQTMVHDGDIQGWAWGPGGTSTGAVPEPPGEICPKPTATPIATVTPGSPASSTSTPAPERPPSTPVSQPAAVVTSIPTTADAASQPPATDAPSGIEPQAPAAPAATPQSAVEGAGRSPATAPSIRAATTAPAPTPKAGAIVIDELQGSANQARSESPASDPGGSRTSLIAFAIVAGTLAAAAAGVVYRRRRAV